MPGASTISVAPMMDYSDRHFRFMMRQLTRRSLLYTEMVTSGALLHGEAPRHLAYHPDEHPLALQLGGDDPAALAECAKMAADAGYDEVNLNVGCPSDRVQKGRFGACLMAHPKLVARIVMAMKAAVNIPVTVKHRIGIDGAERYEDLRHFVQQVAESGCDAFIVHARIAVLAGLSPKQNRSIPPLRYEEVYRLKREHPELAVMINGGIDALADAEQHLREVDGCMIGRAAVNNPFVFGQVDCRFFGSMEEAPSRRQVVERILPYLADHVAAGGKAYRVTRHLLPLFAGQPGNRAWKRELTERSNRCEDPVQMVRGALARFSDEILDAS